MMRLLQIILAYGALSAQLIEAQGPLISRITHPPIDSFTLIDTTTLELRTVRNGDVIDIGPSSKFLTIRANILGLARSVAFSMDGEVSRVDNMRPFTLGGTILGNYVAVPELALEGTHVLSATAYTGRSMKGNAGTTTEITFTLIDSTTSSPTSAPSPEVAPTMAPTRGNSFTSMPTPPSDMPSLIPTISFAPSDETPPPSDMPSMLPTIVEVRRN